MTQDLIEFAWEVAESGYFWETTRATFQPKSPPPLPEDATEDDKLRWKIEEFKSRPRQFLTDRVAIGEAGFRKTTFPLRHQAFVLHREFADTPMTPEGILSFANKYGRLGGDLTESIPVQKSEKGQLLGYGEDISLWFKEIGAARDALDVWDAVRDLDEGRLSEWIRWEDDAVCAEWEDRRLIDIASREIKPRIYQHLVPGEVLAPALLAVQSIVNAHLWEKSRAVMGLLWNVESKKLELHVVPNGLIGAIWLDFATAIDGKKEYRRCVQCGTAFPLAEKGKRRKFCSDRCRVAHFRQGRNAT